LPRQEKTTTLLRSWRDDWNALDGFLCYGSWQHKMPEVDSHVPTCNNLKSTEVSADIPYIKERQMTPQQIKPVFALDHLGLWGKEWKQAQWST
jgi:hypothetical protein